MHPSSPDDLMTLDDPAFLLTWEEIVGEPPAVLLDRAEMVAILLDLDRAGQRRFSSAPAASDPGRRG